MDPTLFLKCSQCYYQASTNARYIKHVVLHRNDVGMRYVCPYSDCQVTVNTHESLRSHFQRHHALYKRSREDEIDTVGTMCDQVFLCNQTFCGERLKDSKNYILHLRNHLKEGQCVQCPFIDCNGMYQNDSSFRSHISRCHGKYIIKDFKPSNYVNPIPEEAPEEVDMCEPLVDDDDDPGIDVVEDDLDDYDEVEEVLLGRSLAMFYMKLESKHIVPISTIQIVVDELSVVTKVGNDCLDLRLKRAMAKTDISENARKSVMEAAEGGNKMLALNNMHFSTQKQRVRYYKENFQYVEAESVFLGFDDQQEACYVSLVPIEKTLSVLVSNPGFLKYCDTHSSTDGALRDVSDGRVYKAMKCKTSGQPSLDILLYQDGFEILNPLGSGRGKHKVYAVYFTLLNIPPKFRSLIDHLQLALLVKESHIKTFGMDAILKPLVSMLNKVNQNGINVNGEVRKVYVAGVSGDNLGAHQVAGFIESFNSTYFCRFCEVTTAQFHEDPLFKGDVRTPESHAENVATVQEEEVGWAKGVKRESVLNELTHYHVCNPGLPPCLAHDLFEGVVNYDMFLFIEYLVKDSGCFTFDKLNRLIKRFRFKVSDRNSIPSIVHVAGRKLGGQAMENAQFVRFFPLIVGHLIPDANNRAWQLMLLLREICQLVMAPVITQEQIAELDIAIKDYLLERQELFPDVRLRPKHHYLTHYPELILQFGPLIRVWTMRFESKHSYFKRIAKAAHNVKNVTSTLANKHQLLQSYLQSGDMFNEEIVVGERKDFHANLFSAEVQTALGSVETQFGPLQTVEKVTCCGIDYTKDQCLLTSATKEGLTTVGQIVLIVTAGKKCFFVCQVHRVELDFDLNLYYMCDEVERTICAPLEDLFDPWSLDVYKVDHCCFLVLKHAPPHRDMTLF